MANPEITNNDPRKLEVFNPVYEEAILYFAGTDTLVEGTIMAQTIAAAGAATPDIGNTGDGTVTGLALAIADGPPLVGDWNLEVTALGVNGRLATTSDADGGNTGTGTVTGFAITVGEFPEIGDWILTCTDPNEGGTATAGAGAYVGTGDGTMDAPTTGVDAIEGDYLFTCMGAGVSGSEVFEVSDPNGVRLASCTVGVAYVTTHVLTTINDGAQDFTVGGVWTVTVTIAHGGIFTLTDPNGVDVKEDIVLPGGAGGTVVVASGGIGFTITDGGTDFDAADFFTLVVVIAEGGTFKLEDPNGNLVAINLSMSGVPLGANTFMGHGMTFIVTDGATDFIVGDKFALTVTDAEHKWQPFAIDAIDGLQFPRGILPEEIVKVGAGSPQRRMLIEGEVYADKLVIDAGGTVTADIIAALRAEGIIARINVELRELDNQ